MKGNTRSDKFEFCFYLWKNYPSPFIVNLAMSYFMDSGQYMPMQFQKVIEVFAIVLLPAAVGMMIRSRLPGFAARMDKPVKILSALFLALIIAILTIQQRGIIGETFALIGIPVVLFNVLSLMTGYFFPQFFNVERKQAIAIGMEIGIHNGTLSIFIALNVLNNPVIRLSTLKSTTGIPISANVSPMMPLC